MLSSDAPELLRTRREGHGFTSLPMGYARPEDWVALGVQNPDRPKLPHPATLVFAPDGTEILRQVHANFKERSDPGVALSAIAAWEAGNGPTKAGTAPPPRGPDWDNAAKASVFREGDDVVLELVVAEGFHAYGSAEQTSVPVYLRVRGVPPPELAPGTRREWSGGVSYVLEGTVQLRATVGGAQSVSGQAGWQLCTDTACSAPRNASFSLEPGERTTLR